eukprot:TRINITY_DN3200_c0_g3_i2.p1 TRINITY_DN3200_c0_g3~~TRINITY_DN3200_c0_g3_i2.p1  ORF type:complete len:251 (+),score=63.98 TRINITY_DN3200_c0_g3_i2:179-931(+)
MSFRFLALFILPLLSANAENAPSMAERIRLAEDLVKHRIAQAQYAEEQAALQLRLEEQASLLEKKAKHGQDEFRDPRKAELTAELRSQSFSGDAKMPDQVGAARIAQNLLMQENRQLQEELNRYEKSVIGEQGGKTPSLLVVSSSAGSNVKMRLLPLLQITMLLVAAVILMILVFTRADSSDKSTSWRFWPKGLLSTQAVPGGVSSWKQNLYGSFGSSKSEAQSARPVRHASPPGVVDDDEEQLIWSHER